MTESTNRELQSALPAIASLLSKSEKAQARLAPGSWQHRTLQHNIEALRIAHCMINAGDAGAEHFTRSELEAAVTHLSSMIDRSSAALMKFTGGTSQHTLLTNRIRALEMAKSLARASLDGSET